MLAAGVIFAVLNLAASFATANLSLSHQLGVRTVPVLASAVVGLRTGSSAPSFLAFFCVSDAAEKIGAVGDRFPHLGEEAVQDLGQVVQ